ncbi:proteasome adapter and scaffold protein ECM29-like isoform X2 [Zingiber officinale]|uniref:proteasome adapter and scaffold protein ECM29-like isoform X2 n=1 Tax=Zingiber officinale TaxID=94328 RepID=UPI001C4D22AA|nr:proteasome adapter and scaffold protein ECM29-like isoform X2 [Zingiber officinale]
MADTSTSSSTAPSDAEREEMLDRMLTRLALADDDKLEPLLVRILPYSISSLASPSPSIRKSVLEMLSHVNKRVKNCPEISLPFSELWRIYNEANASLMVRNFCIVYIEMAFERLPIQDKVSMAPNLLVNISKIPPQHQEVILRIVSKAIGDHYSSQVTEKIGPMYSAIGDSDDRQVFVEFCLYTILYQPPSSSVTCPAGLSVVQSNRVTGKLPLKGELLTKRKLGMLNVIEAMQLAPEIVYPLYLAAVSDSQESVVKKGEELLKRKSTGVNLEDTILIKKLFILFNGNVGVESIAADSKVTPVNVAMRVRLMSIFCRSITAANAFPSTLQCIFSCIYGDSTISRLKQLGMEFTVWVFKHAIMDQLKLMAPVILSGIIRSLDASKAEAEAVPKDVKIFAYQAIGLLASRMPHLFREKIDMALRMFTALKSEDQSLHLTIQDTIICLAVAYKSAPVAVLKEIEELVFENSQAAQSDVRFCAIRWATSLFDTSHCPSRYICILGAADSKMDIREMALEGLQLMEDQEQTSEVNADLKYPDLTNMLHYICNQQPKLLNSSEIGERMLLFPSKTYVAMVKFLMKCFKADFESSKINIETVVSHSEIFTLFSILEHAMAFEGSVELHATASKALVEIGAYLPELVATHYAERLSWLKPLLSHIDTDTRESASRLLGIACSALPSPIVSTVLSEISDSIGGSTHTSRFENRHGALCALGYMAAECIKEPPKIPEAHLKVVIDTLVHVVENENSELASVAMEALGHIGLRCTLSSYWQAGILTVLQGKLNKLLSGDDIKSIQRILISLGHISLKETSFEQIQCALDLIFSLCRSKVEEILFASGEALSFIWGGVPVTVDMILKSNYNSLSKVSSYLTAGICASKTPRLSLENDINIESQIRAQEVIIRKLFDVLLYSTRKEERCAGTVWLVSLLMYCGHHPKIQHILPEIQEAFSHLLGEQNDLTQELASQGMSIVYELGDPSMKESLVNALVSTLTGTGKRKRAIKLMDDSEVFQEGAIGDTLSGGKLSTYKELCSLANEMGQPDLIYKFMDLANYQASLNSKRGAAFGFSKIAKQAGDALQPYLRTLIPRLVRYQYDPDKNVQDAMGHIWKSIVADSKKTIDEHFDYIVDDLLAQSGSRLWRSREASCYALADLIQGRKFSEVSRHLKSIWTIAFRAMDDIKETVRNSGDSLCRAVTSLTTRMCDISLTSASDASETMNIVLPLLIAEGIVSKVSSIQKASIAMVMKLAKNAGIAIRPHLPDLVSCMLECLSSLEDQRLNYVEMHAANVGIQTEKLDNLRIAVAKDSPMWETLHLCLKVVDAKSLDLLVPRLAQLIRSGVGLNTRVGVASFITLLVEQVASDIKAFTGSLLKLTYHAVLEEKSSSLKRAFAVACAVILNHANPSQAQKVIEDTATLHYGERNAQLSCAILLKAYSSLAAGVLSGYQVVVVPVVFLSRFEDEKDIGTIFEELWEENSSSERVTLQLYLGEVVALLCNSLASSSWASKRKSAKAIQKLSEILGESLSRHHLNLLRCLLKELPGRLWEGKDVILHAIASLCSSCHETISLEDPTMPSLVLEAMMSACSKKNKIYRDAAFSCLQQVVKEFNDPEFFTSVFPMLYDVCKQAIASKTMNTSSISLVTETGEDKMEETSVSLNEVLDCVASCIHVARLQDILKNSTNLIEVLSISLSPGLNWSVKMSVFTSIKELCSKLDHVSHGIPISSNNSTPFIFELFHSVAPKVVECIHVVKISQVHVAASECLLQMIELYRDTPPHNEDIHFLAELSHLCEIEKSAQAKTLLRQCITILEDIKCRTTSPTNKTS